SSSVPVAPFAAISSSVFDHSSRVFSWPNTLSGPWHSLQTLKSASRPGPGGNRDAVVFSCAVLADAGGCDDDADVAASVPDTSSAPTEIATSGARALISRF